MCVRGGEGGGSPKISQTLISAYGPKPNEQLLQVTRILDFGFQILSLGTFFKVWFATCYNLQSCSYQCYQFKATLCPKFWWIVKELREVFE